MRIATYNIWNSATGMPERKQQLIEEIIKISADIICLQEVPNKAAHQDLVERCRYQFAVFHKHANEEEGLSILSRYSIKSFEFSIITKKEKYCISRWTIIIMRANGQLCFWKKRLQNIIEH